MAIDTRNRRASVVGLAMAITLTLPAPDGTVSQADRQHVAVSYSGVKASAALSSRPQWLMDRLRLGGAPVSMPGRLPPQPHPVTATVVARFTSWTVEATGQVGWPLLEPPPAILPVALQSRHGQVRAEWSASLGVDSHGQVDNDAAIALEEDELLTILGLL